MKNQCFILFTVILLCCCSPCVAQDQPVGKPDIYDPQSDIKILIETGLKSSRESNKHLLLMFGGNWCPWCHKLHELFETDALIKALLDSSFILVLVDVGEKNGEPLNRDLVEKYRVGGFGYPALAVVGKDGALLSSQSTGVLEKGKGHDPERVLWYLKSQAPGM